MMRQLPFGLVFLLLFGTFFPGCETSRERKIKLASVAAVPQTVSQTASSVLQISPAQQRSVAILNFQNLTNDRSLDWLRRGLTDMLTTEFAQSRYINVITMQRLSEVAQQSGKGERDLDDPSTAAAIARQASAEIILTGRFYHQYDSLCIEVEMIDAVTTQILRRETVRGASLERIFAMVDSLSERLRATMRGNMEERSQGGVTLAEITHSVEAFRYYSMGLENMDKFLWNEAAKCFKDALKYDSTFAAAYLRLGQIHSNMDRNSDGKQLLHKARQYSDKLSETDRICLEVAEAKQADDFPGLLAILEQAVLRMPSDVDIRQDLARTLYHSCGDIDRALEHFEIALELDPGRKLLYNDLAYLYAERGDYTTALKYLDTYQEMAPDEPNPYDSRGEILINAGRLDEATVQFQTALEKWPAFSNSAYRLAGLYREFWDYDRSLTYIKRVREVEQNPMALSEIDYVNALTLWRFGKTREAETALLKMLNENPYSDNVIIILGELYQSAGDSLKAKQLYASAFERFKEKLSREPENLIILHDFSDFIAHTNWPPGEALPILEKAAASHTDPIQQAHFDLVLGLLYLRSGQFDKAEQHFQYSRPQQLDLISITRYRGWSNFWKFLFEVMAYEDGQTPPEGRFSQQLLATARQKNRKDLEVIARFVEARRYASQKNTAALAAEYQILGAPLEKTWRVIGPFSTRGVSGFQHPFPPEKGIDLGAAYPAEHGELRWKSADDGVYDGYVNLRALFQRSDWAAGYALIYVYSPDQRKVQIRPGIKLAGKLWLNNEQIWERYCTKSIDTIVDRDIVTVLLHPGYNRLLLKVTNTIYDWGFFFRVTDERGNGFNDITFHTPEEADRSFAADKPAKPAL